MRYLKNSGKIMITAPLSKLYPQNLYQCYLLMKVYFKQNVVRFHAIKSEIKLSQEFRKNGIAAPPIELYILKFYHCYL